MDPHKRSATIEVLNHAERVLSQGRFATDAVGYRNMLAVGRRFSDRIWAVEGCNGIGKHLAQRLVADGEIVVDVPAKLSARARVFSTGQGRKTDATDAHSIAVAALRTPDLLRVRPDDHSVALRMLADRRDELGTARTATVSRPHRLMLELIPGGAKQFLSTTQARTLLATVRPRDLVGKTRRQLAAELITELATLDKKIKAADKQLTDLLTETGTGLLDLYGIGALVEYLIRAGQTVSPTSSPAADQPCSHHGRMIGCAAATDLPRPDQHLRHASPAPDEQPGQRPRDPRVAPPDRSAAAATRWHAGTVQSS
jgi:transposase